MLLTQLQFNGKDRSLPFRTLCIDFPMMQTDNFLRQSQSDARSLIISATCIVSLRETLEDFGKLALGNPHTAIFHPYITMPVIIRHSHRDINIPPGRSELERIGDDVADHDGHFLLIRPYHDILTGQLEREADFIFFGHHPEFFLKRVYHLIQVEQRHMQTHLAVLYFTEIQYLIDQLQHLFGILFHQIHILHSFLR